MGMAGSKWTARNPDFAGAGCRMGRGEVWPEPLK